jgi:hypothetical protein
VAQTGLFAEIEWVCSTSRRKEVGGQVGPGCRVPPARAPAAITSYRQPTEAGFP